MTGERGPSVEMAFRELQRLRPDPWILISMKTVNAMLDTEGVTDQEAVSVFERLADRTVKSSPLGLMRTVLRAVVADRAPAHPGVHPPELSRVDRREVSEAEREMVREMSAFFVARTREVGVSQARAETLARWPEAVES
jgi:hypothetical protein